MRLKKSLNNSVQHTIGMRQTAKPSVTDIRYAKMAKGAAKTMMTLRRRLQRQKAKRKGAAPSLCSGVLKALRMGVWTAYRTTMPQASCILIGVEAAPHMCSIDRALLARVIRVFMECASLVLRMRICMCACVCTIVRACILAQRRNAAGFLGGHCL